MPFAEYYNKHTNLDCGEFSMYQTEHECFGIVAIPVTLANLGFTPEHEALSPEPDTASNTSIEAVRPHGRKPYEKKRYHKPTLTSLLQQTRNLRGVDGLLADLLITSASQHASQARMGTLHFGIRDSKRRNAKTGKSTKNRHPDVAPSGSKTVDHNSMVGIESSVVSTPSSSTI
jgi:hypothetical protein